MDKVLTAIERTAPPKQMLYSDFVGGSMIGIHFGVGICLRLKRGMRGLPLSVFHSDDRAGFSGTLVSNFIQTRLGIRT
jgi:hypothetical protein